MSPDMPCRSQALRRRSLDRDDPMLATERRRIEAHVERCKRGCNLVIDALLRDKTRPAVAPTAVPAASLLGACRGKRRPRVPG